ncbi:hypothetical protein Tco_0760964 [Tanacetum coccineum]
MMVWTPLKAATAEMRSKGFMWLQFRPREGSSRWVSCLGMSRRKGVSKTDERIDKLADQLSTLVEIVSKKVVTPAPVKAVEEICVTCSGPHAWYNCPNTDNNQSSVCAATGTYNQVNPPNRVSNQMAPPGFAPVQNNGQNSGFFQNQASTSGTLPSNTIPNRKVERETEETTDKEQSNFQGSTAHIQPPVNPIPIPEPDVPKTLPKPNIPYPSHENNQGKKSQWKNLGLELKDLPSHLEYAYLEGTDKLPVIIEKGLKDVEKEALLKVLKSHKRAISWKITDIKGIDLRFCTHKILMEDDYKTYGSKSKTGPWVSPVHCVPKKGGITVVANEENELNPTRLLPGGETLGVISSESTPWFADYANFHAGNFIIKGMTTQQKKKFFKDVKHYFWDDPYLFCICADQIIRRCVHGQEANDILKACHEGPTGGHHSANLTARKVLMPVSLASIISRCHYTMIKSWYFCQKKDVLENKDINENFPLETLGVISNGSTPWFVDYANYHAGNFIIKGMTTQQKKKFSRTLNNIFGTIPIFFVFVRIKSFDGVCMGKKLMISSKLVMKDPPGAIIVPISPLEKYLMPVSFGRPYIEMPIQ